MYDALVESAFRQDVVAGLSAPQKHLSSKYFYDAIGDRLFQQIMACPEYYLTRAEFNILEQRSAAIIEACAARHAAFEIVELGAGDASKTVYLLREAIAQGRSRHYLPIDISPGIIDYLEHTLTPTLQGMQVTGTADEYLPALKAIQARSQAPKLVLFLGATIGNWLPAQALAFCQEVRALMKPGDLLLVGFDLKKDPATILAAYNDKAGLTREFNLNLLRRINAELGADFDAAAFAHYPVYDPGTGTCKSYLISRKAQRVRLADGTAFDFAADEAIHMEVSQKYSLPEIRALGLAAGFEIGEAFLDETQGFADVLWQKPLV